MEINPSSPSINAPNGPTTIEVIKSKIDAVLYNAALKGSVGAIHRYRYSLTSQVTPSQNTVLHLHVGVPRRKGANIQFIEKVLEYDNSLLLQKNDNGEIPLHLAARFGHIEAVKIFINQANRTSVECPAEILMTTDKNQDTALHLAARWGNVKIVELLLKADDSRPYDKNRDNETPLYIAAERAHHEVTAMILNLCKSPTFEGPLGRTALHAAVLYRDDREILHKILKKNRSLLKSQDDEGQTPLHYAANQHAHGDRRYINRIFLKMLIFNRAPPEILTILLEYDDPSDSAVYIRDKKGRTALHLAVMYGGVQQIKPLIEHRSDCSEIRDVNGQNLFHYAVRSGEWETVKYLTSIGIFSKLINEKDKDGNTPLHLLSTSLSYAPLSYFFCMEWFLKDKEVDIMAFNSRNQTAADIVFSLPPMNLGYREGRIARFVNRRTPRGIRASLKEAPDQDRLTKAAEKKDIMMAHRKKASEVHIVVATLIATVSFAAGIAVPGGFDPNLGANQGTALLARQHAFRAFMVSDSVALTFSAVAILLHFHIASFNEPGVVEFFFHVSVIATTLSLGAMIVAFMTGTNAILYQTSPSLPSTISLIATISLGLCAAASLLSFAGLLLSYVQLLTNCALGSYMYLYRRTVAGFRWMWSQRV